MNHGKVEQVATPRELYEQPANEFVMTFVGQAHRFDDRFVRPHDLEVTLRARTARRARRWSSASPISASRCRVELATDDGRPFSVQVYARRIAELELEQGQIVWVRSSRPPSPTAFAVASSAAVDRGRQLAAVGEVGERRLLEHERALRSAGRSRRRGAAAAVPTYSTSSGRTPRTVAIGPSTARITSATVISAAAARAGSRRRGRAGFDEAAVAQLEQDVLEELGRDRLRRGDPLALDRAAAATASSIAARSA